MQQNQNQNKVAAAAAPRRVISLLVDNHNGVLARVSSLFCRRGFNIDSLTVSATNDPAVSRITVTLHGDDAAISQLILQTERLEVTRQVFELTPDKSLQRELLLLKVACNTAERADMREVYQAISALPESLRLPLCLKYLEDLSEKEAAQALGLTVTTFKSRLHRARKLLRKSLDREVTLE